MSETRVLPAHEKLIESLAYSPDGQILVSCGWDRTVRLWNVEEGREDWGKESASLPHASHVFSVAMTPDGQYLGAGGVERLTLWRQRPSGDWERVLEQPGAACRSVAAAPDSRSLAAGWLDGTIQLWDLETLRPTTIRPALKDVIREVAYSADGAYLAASAYNGQLQVWRLCRGGEPEPLTLPISSVVSFAIHPTAPLLAASTGAASETRLVLWNLKTGKEIVRLAGCELGNNTVRFSPDGRLLASGDKDNTIRLYNAATTQLLATLEDHLGWVKALAFAPDGRRIAFGGQDGTVRFREVPGEAFGSLVAAAVPWVEDAPSKNSRRESKTGVTDLSEKPCG